MITPTEHAQLSCPRKEVCSMQYIFCPPSGCYSACLHCARPGRARRRPWCWAYSPTPPPNRSSKPIARWPTHWKKPCVDASKSTARPTSKPLLSEPARANTTCCSPRPISPGWHVRMRAINPCSNTPSQYAGMLVVKPIGLSDVAALRGHTIAIADPLAPDRAGMQAELAEDGLKAACRLPDHQCRHAHQRRPCRSSMAAPTPRWWDKTPTCSSPPNCVKQLHVLPGNAAFIQPDLSHPPAFARGRSANHTQDLAGNLLPPLKGRPSCKRAALAASVRSIATS